MDRKQIREKLIFALQEIAPEAADEELDDKTALQDQIDLDSVDLMNYIVKVQEDLKVEVPNQEYRSFFSLEGAINFIEKVINV